MRTKLPRFGVRSIQRGRRIALDDELLQNLGIQEGDQVELFLDTEEEAIIIKKFQDLHLERKSGSRKQRQATTERRSS